MKKSIFETGSKRISIGELFGNNQKPKRSVLLDYIENLNNCSFTAGDIKKVLNGQATSDTINNTLSRLCVNGALIRISKGVYIKGLKKVSDITPLQMISTPNERWSDENGPNKIFITDLQYKKVSTYFNGDSMILCGPNVDLRIRQSECITNGNHNLFLVDNNSNIFELINNKIKTSGKKHVIPIFKNIFNVNNHAQFQDLDFCATSTAKDSKFREAGEILAYRLIKQKKQNYPIAAMNFTFCVRGSEKKIVNRQINSILHILDASLTMFDNNTKGRGKGITIIPKTDTGFGFLHIPNWITKGKVLELDFYTYSDTSCQMITCLIIYKP